MLDFCCPFLEKRCQEYLRWVTRIIRGTGKGDGTLTNNKEESSKQRLEKFKVIYELAKSQYDEEIDRFRKLDDKAAKFFSLLALMLGGFGFFGKWLLDTIKYPGTCWEWGLLITGFLVALSLIASGVLTLLALQILELDKPSSDLETVKDLSTNPLKTLYIRLAKSFVIALNANREKTSRKTHRLTWSYYTTITALILLVVLVALFAWHTLGSKRQGPVDFRPYHLYNLYTCGK
jgi:hypothetical protein